MTGTGIVKIMLVVLAGLFVRENFAEDKCQNNVNCELPDCFCVHRGARQDRPSPGELDPTDIPQMIVFSFDDAVNVQNIDIYDRLFPPTIKNPNGCPISMTLFVSHNFTDYSMVRSLYNRGIEIASHSITHRLPAAFWKNVSKDEMIFEAWGGKQLLSAGAGIPLEEIRGWRAPFLQVGGDTAYEVLQDMGFEYDSSLLGDGISGSTQQQWPFTLDFGYPLKCQIKPCPKDRYRGFWEVPVVPLCDRMGIFPCSYLDSCFFPPMTKREALGILYRNFYKNFNGNREPLYINLHSSWFFLRPYRMEAIQEFIQTVLRLSCEVYIVNMHQALEWVRNPTRNQDLPDFEPWQC